MRLAMKIPLATFTVLAAIVLTLVSGTHEKRDLNKADILQLEQIPGIGPSIASRIVLERNRRGGFRSMDDLLKIRGISRKTLIHLNTYYTVEQDLDDQKIEPSDFSYVKPSDVLKETYYD